MSNSSWKEQLARTLATLAKKIESGREYRLARVAFLGIGNELNGDDAAGVEVIRRLRDCLKNNPNVLLLEGATAPENFTGAVRRFAADLVVMVDCAEMQALPGEIAWLEFSDLDGLSASTHSLPPSVLAEFLQGEIGCGVALIGIQPETVEFGFSLSSTVQSAVDEIVAGAALLLTP